MTYHKEEYTLHNGKKIYALYDEHNVCQATKECIEMLLDLYQQGRADAIDDFAKAIICELKNKHTDMPIVDILGSREKWKEKNSQYLECENLAYKIAKKLKAGETNE